MAPKFNIQNPTELARRETCVVVSCAHRDESDAKDNMYRRMEMDTFVSNVCIYAMNIVRAFLCESHMDRVSETTGSNTPFLMNSANLSAFSISSGSVRFLFSGRR